MTTRLGRVTVDAARDWTYSGGTTGYRYNSPGVLTQPTLDSLLTGEFQTMIYRTTALTVGLTIPPHRRVNLRIFDRYQRGSLFDWQYLGFEDGQASDHRVYTDSGPTDYSVNMLVDLLEVQSYN